MTILTCCLPERGKPLRNLYAADKVEALFASLRAHTT